MMDIHVLNKTALIVVDMQNYYLKKESSYYKYFDHIQPGCLEYIINRCENTAVPNIKKLIQFFREKGLSVIYLRLCGKSPDRTDLHRFFRETYEKGKKYGYDDIYPLDNTIEADIIDELKPEINDIIINKRTFSPFSSSNFDTILKEIKINTLVFTGLATSQCVETTARDSSDYGYDIIHIEDAQADYEEIIHRTSLFSSQGVCGGIILSTNDFIHNFIE